MHSSRALYYSYGHVINQYFILQWPETLKWKIWSWNGHHSHFNWASKRWTERNQMQKAGLKIKKTADLPYNLQECHLYTFLNTWTENLTYSFVYFIYLYILLLFPLFLYTLAIIIISLIPLYPSRACALFPHSHKASGSCPDSHVCSVFVWLLSLFWFCLSEFIFHLPIPGMCLLDHSFVLFARCCLNLFALDFSFLVIACSLVSYFFACCSVLWSCLLCLVCCVLSRVCFCSVSCFPWLLFSRPGHLTGLGSLQLKASSTVAQAAAWSPVISLTCAALSPLFSSQALSRSDFGHPPVLQQTALSYCLNFHFSPVIPVLSINVTPLIILYMGLFLSSKLLWQNPDIKSLREMDN